MWGKDGGERMKCKDCFYYQPSKKNPLKGTCILRNNEYYQDIRYGHLKACKMFDEVKTIVPRRIPE